MIELSRGRNFSSKNYMTEQLNSWGTFSDKLVGQEIVSWRNRSRKELPSKETL